MGYNIRAINKKGYKVDCQISETYNNTNGEYIVRREDPERVIQLLSENKPYEISNDLNSKHLYENCVVWDKTKGPESLRIAFTEGRGEIGGLVMITGVKARDGLEVKKLPRIKDVNRDSVRCLQGEINSKDIKFIIIRTPATRFPEEEMTDDEIEKLEDFLENNSAGNIPQIFRGFTKEY